MHKKTNKNSLFLIKKYVNNLSSSMRAKSNLELIEIINSQKSQSEKAKNLIIYRFLLKILKQSRIIFYGQIINHWNKEEIIQTGIKAILYAIQDFSKKEKKQRSEALFTYMACFYINKYLNKKKINYDPLIQFNKGPEFKRIFYIYPQTVKKLFFKNNKIDHSKICEKKLCNTLNTNTSTLREVQYAHQKISIIKSQEEKHQSNKNSINANSENELNYVDYALSNNWVSETTAFENDPINIVIKNEKRDITKYKNILSDTEYKFLDLLNSGSQKEEIYSYLKISRQRFSFLKNNITKKIRKYQGGVYL